MDGSIDALLIELNFKGDLWILKDHLNFILVKDDGKTYIYFCKLNLYK